jgi:hypothetical protein
MHDFKIGQYVYYVPRNRLKAEGRYAVMRLLPQSRGRIALRRQKPRQPGTRIHG